MKILKLVPAWPKQYNVVQKLKQKSCMHSPFTLYSSPIISVSSWNYLISIIYIQFLHICLIWELLTYDLCGQNLCLFMCVYVCEPRQVCVGDWFLLVAVDVLVVAFLITILSWKPILYISTFSHSFIVMCMNFLDICCLPCKHAWFYQSPWAKVRCPGARVIKVCEFPWWCWNLDLSFMPKQLLQCYTHIFFKLFSCLMDGLNDVYFIHLSSKGHFLLYDIYLWCCYYKYPFACIVWKTLLFLLVYTHEMNCWSIWKICW